jgi:CRISPR/Cas system-associated exonuclease Cas4 (RecB family)
MCPEQVWLKIHNQPKRGVSANLLIGTGIHSATEAYYRSVMNKSPLSVDVLFNLFRIKFEQTPTSEVLYGATKRDEIFATARALLELLVKQEVPANIVAIEPRLSFQIAPSLTVIGRPDIIYRERNGDLVLVDLKTAAKAYGASEIRAVTEQLFTYSALAIPEPVRLKAKVFLKKKKTPEVVDIDLDPDKIDFCELRDKFLMVKRSIEAGIHYRSRGWQCGGCGYRYLCDQNLSTQYQDIESEAA